MRLKTLFTLLIAAFACSCSSLPEKYSAAPTRCLVQGTATGQHDAFNRAMLGRLVPGEATGATRVLIRSVDGGDILWVRGSQLGDKVWVEPGKHRVSVMCETRYPTHRIMSGTEVEIDAKAGHTYFLSADPLKSVSEKPKVEVREEKSQR